MISSNLVFIIECESNIFENVSYNMFENLLGMLKLFSVFKWEFAATEKSSSWMFKVYILWFGVWSVDFLAISKVDYFFLHPKLADEVDFFSFDLLWVFIKLANVSLTHNYENRKTPAKSHAHIMNNKIYARSAFDWRLRSTQKAFYKQFKWFFFAIPHRWSCCELLRNFKHRRERKKVEM